MNYFLLVLWILITFALFSPWKKISLVLALLFSYFYLTWEVVYGFIK